MTDYEKQQRRWIKNCKLEVGDTVLIVDRLPHYQTWGSGFGWIAPMDMTVGNEYMVRNIDHTGGIQLSEGVGYGWIYPFFVLVKT